MRTTLLLIFLPRHAGASPALELRRPRACRVYYSEICIYVEMESVSTKILEATSIYIALMQLATWVIAALPTYSILYN